MVDIYDEIFTYAKTYFQSNSTDSPKVLKDFPEESKIFPLVVITQSEDKLEDENLDKTDQESTVNFEIEIFTTDTATTNRQVIAQRLKAITDTIFNTHFGFKRISCNPIPNADRNITRIYMRYSAIVNMNKRIRR
jgi:hypothetical protein